MTKERDASYEVLRILAMLFIVINHFAMFVKVGANEYISYFFCVAGKLGVNLFVFISGYFLCMSTMRIKKIISLLVKTWIYSMTCFLVCVVFFDAQFTVKNLIYSALPCITREYWFITAYIGVYVLSTFINTAYKCLETKQRFQLICVLTVMLSVIPTLTTMETWTSELLWMIYLYMVGMYIRMDFPLQLKKKKIWLPIFLVLYLGIFASSIVIEKLSHSYSVLQYHIGHFRNMTSFPLLVASVALFIFWSNLKITHGSKCIFWFSKSTLAVCLIHENPYVKDALWGFLSGYKMGALMYIGYILAGSLIIYLGCILIDKVYENGCSLLKITFDYIRRKKSYVQ